MATSRTGLDGTVATRLMAMAKLSIKYDNMLNCGFAVRSRPGSCSSGFVRSDTDSLVAAMTYVAGLDRGACRAVAETRFSAKRMAAEHVEVYTAAMHNTKPE